MVFNSTKKLCMVKIFFITTCRYNYAISHVYQLKQMIPLIIKYKMLFS